MQQLYPKNITTKIFSSYSNLPPGKKDGRYQYFPNILCLKKITWKKGEMIVIFFIRSLLDEIWFGTR